MLHIRQEEGNYRSIVEPLNRVMDNNGSLHNSDTELADAGTSN